MGTERVGSTTVVWRIAQGQPLRLPGGVAPDVFRAEDSARALRLAREAVSAVGARLVPGAGDGAG